MVVCEGGLGAGGGLGGATCPQCAAVELTAPVAHASTVRGHMGREVGSPSTTGSTPEACPRAGQ